MLIVRFLKQKYESPNFYVTTAKVMKSDSRHFRVGRYIVVKSRSIPNRLFDNAFELKGKAIHDPKYGWQFEMAGWRELVGITEKAVRQFLERNIKGVGPAASGKIYKALGAYTIRKLDNDSSLLVKILGEKKGETARRSYEQERLTNRNITDLMLLGLKYKVAEKALKTHTLSEIRKNPYVLTDVRGIGFKMADTVAASVGTSKTSPDRIKAAVLNTCEENENSGNCGIGLGKLRYKTSVLLGGDVTEPEITNTIYAMAKAAELKTLSLEGSYIFYRPQLYNVENRVAGKLAELVKRHQYLKTVTDGELEEAQESVGIKLHELQVKAVKQAFAHPVSIITGGPGTGKTSILKVICAIHMMKGKTKPSLVSPTGKAARRMTEAVGIKARTIHAALDISPSNMSDPQILPSSLVIVDETSMMDIYLTDALLKAIPPKCHVVFVGDADQLPSVGCGAVLADMITSGCIPTTRLTKIYRQKAGSTISVNAALINEGSTEFEYGGDFRFCEETGNIREDERKLAELYEAEVGKYSVSEVCLLCPQKRNTLGVRNMNTVIQNGLNPNPSGMRGEFYTFKEGDIVMQTVNSGWAVNGDVGTVKRYMNEDKAESILVEFSDDRKHTYTEDDIDMLILAYAITVHKSQGSEYRSVIIAMDSDVSPLMLKRNLLYTAVTRGKADVTIFGNMDNVRKAARTVDKEKRMTLLAEKIRNACSGSTEEKTSAAKGRKDS